MTVLQVVLIKPSQVLEDYMLDMSIAQSDEVWLRLIRVSLKAVLSQEQVRGDIFLCDADIISESNLQKLLACTSQLILYGHETPGHRPPSLFKQGVIDYVVLPSELGVLEAHLLRIKKQKNERVLLEKNYLSGLGTLAAGIAHEINNPLGYLQNNLAVLSKYVNQLLTWVDQTRLDPDDQEYLSFIHEDCQDIFSESKEGIHQVSGIVNSLRAYSKVDYASIRYEVLLSEEIDHVLNLLASELYSGITIQRHYETQGKIVMSSGNIGIAIMNVIKNAFDALLSTSKVDKKLDIQLLDKDDEVHIVIEDNGPGMDLDTRRKIFEPFYTTKPVGSATGLGLSTVYRIIAEDHNGKIYCESKLGDYTRFHIWLPKS